MLVESRTHGASNGVLRGRKRGDESEPDTLFDLSTEPDLTRVGDYFRLSGNEPIPFTSSGRYFVGFKSAISEVEPSQGTYIYVVDTAWLGTNIITLDDPIPREVPLNRESYVEFHEVEHLGRTLQLRHPIRASWSSEDGAWILEYAGLGIFAGGVTKSAAKREFAEDFLFLWDEIACEEDHRLTGDARLVKELLRYLVVPTE